MPKNQNNGSHTGAVLVTAGLVAAAATGAYFLYGSKNAKKYRSKVKSWMFTAKGEILNELEKLENVGEAEYHMIVDKVAEKYKAMQGVDADDVAKLAADLKKHWKTISKTVIKKVRGSKTKK